MDAIVLAAGPATRLRPLSYVTAKVLLPVAGRPCLDYIISNLRTAGPSRVIVAVSSVWAGVVRSYVQHVDFGVPIEVCPCPGLETGGDLLHAVRASGIKGPLLCCNGDTVTNVDLGPLLRHHRAEAPAMTMALFPVSSDCERFGTAVLEKGRIVHFVEKPRRTLDTSGQPSYANMGYYVMEEEVIDKIPSNSVRLEDRIFPALAEAGRMAGCVMNVPYWMDIGTVEGYIEANRLALEGRIVPPVP